MVLAMATYGPRLDRYSGVSGLVGSHGRSQSAFRTRISRQVAASFTLMGRRLTGPSRTVDSVSVTQPRARAIDPSSRAATVVRHRVATIPIPIVPDCHGGDRRRQPGRPRAPATA